MRFFAVPIAIIAPCAYVALAESPEPLSTWDFEGAAVGQLPTGWKSDKTGAGEGSVWKIVDDATAPKGTKVLAQTSESPESMFNLCIADGSTMKDVTLSVAFKSVRGKTDQGGGVVWRYRDANNYYIARVNPLEDNFRLFRVVNGKRTQIASKDNLSVPVGEWHTMSVTMKGEQIKCLLDGKEYLSATDGTFAEAGKVGLWTKADAQTYFDNVQAMAAK